jgi:hypothetical protein
MSSVLGNPYVTGLASRCLPPCVLQQLRTSCLCGMCFESMFACENSLLPPIVQGDKHCETADDVRYLWRLKVFVCEDAAVSVILRAAHNLGFC